jgi:2-polyprenyl-3-methyl-5-hydroxy-6-metoxy-1,4-benzoquinol methylase
MTDLQRLQRRLGFAGDREAVALYQNHYASWFPAKGRVLDVGCGEGVFLEHLRANGYRAIGVDSSADDVAAARARGLEVVQDDALAFLARSRGAFEGIFCAHVIEHLPTDGAVSLIEHVREALTPGGRAIVITPDPLDLEVITERFWLDLTHVRPYPEALLVSLFRELGFRVLAHGNDPRSARRASWKNWPIHLYQRLRFGRHAFRGDVFVVAERT